MLKYLAMLAIVALMAIGVSGQPNKAPHQKQQSAKQSQPAVIVANGEDKQDCGQTDQAKAKPDPPKWYAALKRPDWWLVVAAFLTFGTIGWQSIETRRAAKAMQDSIPHQEKAANGAQLSSKAAADNIELVISKECARIRVEIGELMVDSSTPIPVEVTYKLFCDGPTPAFITAAWATVDATESSDVSIDRLAGLRITFPMPNISPVFHPNSQGRELRAFLFQVMEGAAQDLINNRNVFIHFHGIVEYTDVFDRQCYTRFRYLWDVQNKPWPYWGLDKTRFQRR